MSYLCQLLTALFLTAIVSKQALLLSEARGKRESCVTGEAVARDLRSSRTFLRTSQHCLSRLLSNLFHSIRLAFVINLLLLCSLRRLLIICLMLLYTDRLTLLMVRKTFILLQVTRNCYDFAKRGETHSTLCLILNMTMIIAKRRKLLHYLRCHSEMASLINYRGLY